MNKDEEVNNTEHILIPDTNQNELNETKSRNNSSEKEESFREFRKHLNDEDNLLGKLERCGVRFNRKYINNVLHPNIRLYYTNVKAIDTDTVKLVANVCIVHGFSQYSRLFYELAYFLAKNGMNCHLIDLRGHGYSGGPRLDWTIEDMHSDIISLIKQAETDNLDLPLYVFGHSMGGGLVSSLFINNQFLQVHGVILSAPLLGIPLNVDHHPIKSFILSKIGNNMRDFCLHGNINPTDICKDEGEVIRIINDKLMIPLATPRSFRSLMKNSERILENSKFFNLPCLVLHGEKDKICNHSDSKTFIDSIKHKLKELYSFKDGHHDAYIDHEKDEFRNKVLSWILKTKSQGKTDKPFPIDIIIGPPKAAFNKIKFSVVMRIILFIIYFYIAYKSKSLIKGKIARMFWPVSLLHYFYDNYLRIN